MLTGKYKPGQPLPEGSRATDEKGGADMIKRFMRDEVLEAVQRLQPVADQAGLTLAQLAIAWTLQNPNVASAIVGASRPEQVTDNVKAAGVQLDADALRAIDEALGDIPERDASKTVSPAGAPRVDATPFRTGGAVPAGTAPPVRRVLRPAVMARARCAPRRRARRRALRPSTGHGVVRCV